MLRCISGNPENDGFEAPFYTGMSLPEVLKKGVIPLRITPSRIKIIFKFLLVCILARKEANVADKNIQNVNLIRLLMG